MTDLFEVLNRRQKGSTHVKEFTHNPVTYDFHEDGRLALDHSPEEQPKKTRDQLLGEAQAKTLSPEMRSKMVASDRVDEI